MTKEDYIKLLLTAVISVVAKGFFDKLIGPYIPNAKKLLFFFKNLVLRLFQYLLPIYFITISFINDPIDKWFIFKVSTLTAAILFNLMVDIWLAMYRRQQDTEIKFAQQMDAAATLMSRLTDAVIVNNKDVNESFKATVENSIAINSLLERVANDKETELKEIQNQLEDLEKREAIQIAKKELLEEEKDKLKKL